MLVHVFDPKVVFLLNWYIQGIPEHLAAEEAAPPAAQPGAVAQPAAAPAATAPPVPATATAPQNLFQVRLSVSVIRIIF